jgi:DNA-binding SARP family transcriptional activator
VHEFRILGPIEVAGDKGPVRLGGLKQRATLAILLLSANRIVSVERLADDLYAGAPPTTAVTQVQRQISGLRKTLGSASTIETRPPGYVIRLASERLDLNRFERQTRAAGEALVQGEAEQAADLLRQALQLWRGAPLADLAYEPFAQTSIARLEEIRLAALEQRIEADLALGRHHELVGELEQLVFEHPLHERLRAQLMLALYRSGRQAEALDVYRRTRAALVEELGLEPTQALIELERAILAQDPALDLARGAPPPGARPDPPTRAVLVLPADDRGLEALLAIGEPLGRRQGRELLIARLLTDEGQLPQATAELNARRGSLEVAARTAAFTTLEPARDVVRLATSHDVDLVLLEAPPALDAETVPADLAAILERSPADVAVLAGAVSRGAEKGIAVPFGGGEHDWAALELRRGSHPPPAGRCGSSARGRTLAAVSATRAVCWQTRLWPCSAWSEWRRSRSSRSRRKKVCLRPSSWQRSSSSASPRAGRSKASGRPGARSSGTPALPR